MVKKVRKYKLVIKHNGNVKELPTRQDDLKNPTNFLSNIDLFTMNFSNKEELCNYFVDELKLSGITDFKNCKVSVNYKAAKKTIELEPAFAEKKYLKEFATGAETYMNDKVALKFSQTILTDLYDRNPLFIRFLLDTYALNTRLEDIVKDYVYNRNLGHENEIRDHLSRYLVARRILTELVDYEKFYKRSVSSIKLANNLDEPPVYEQMEIFDIDKSLEKPKEKKLNRRGK